MTAAIPIEVEAVGKVYLYTRLCTPNPIVPEYENTQTRQHVDWYN